MNKTVLLAAAAAFALTAGGASAAPTLSGAGHYTQFHMPKKSKMLYNQNSSYASDGVASQNFTSGDFTTYDCQGADDFVVPKGATWTISEVDVSGTTSEGGTPTSEDVTFYKGSKKGSVPGKAVKGGTLTGLNGNYSSGDIAISLGKKGVKLKAGTYWVSVAVNMSFEASGQWYWDVNKTVHGNQAVWQNPGGGFGLCPSWGTIETCNGSTGPDLMFDLQGTSKGKK